MNRAITLEGFDAETGTWQHVAVVLVDVPDTVTIGRVTVGRVTVGDYTFPVREVRDDHH